MWLKDVAHELVNMDNVMFMEIVDDYCDGVFWTIEAHPCVETQDSLLYRFGTFQTYEEAEQELEKMIATLNDKQQTAITSKFCHQI